MPLYYLIILALVQGITEFLPVSSSGHLVLVHEFLSSTAHDQWSHDLLLDVAVHVGTLLSVLLYFHRDIWTMIRGCLSYIQPSKMSHTGDLPLHLPFFIILSSLPVIAAGFALHALAPAWLRSAEVMAWSTLIFGALLWWVDAKRPLDKTLVKLDLRGALIIGLAQILALIPGTSRSGITMTAARGLGFNRTESAKYSLFLAIVAISGAGTLGGLDLLDSDDLSLGIDVLVAVGLSFVSGLIAIKLMMNWLSKASFKIFGIYRLLLGAILLGLIYTGII